MTDIVERAKEAVNMWSTGDYSGQDFCNDFEELIAEVERLEKERDELQGKFDYWYKEAAEQTDARWFNAKEKEKLIAENAESDKNLISCQRCGAAGFIDSSVGDDKICPDCDGEGAVDQGEIERLRGENKSLKEYAKQIADAVYMKAIKELETQLAESEKKVDLVNKHEPNLLNYLENKAGIK